jgi:mRNA-degrading endonuclease RelE of RelBE toxin-antitoxin system
LYKIEFLPEAREFYQRLYYSDRSHFDRIKAALIFLREDPFQGKSLKHDFKGKYSFRVGSYRIIYKIVKESITIYIFDIGHRRNVYN